MRSRSQNVTFSISHLCFIALVIVVMLAGGFAQSAFAQNKCDCWIDTKTGKQVPIVPAGGAERDLTDPNRAFNSRTGQNFYHQPDGCWIDTKTGKSVPTVPAGGAERDLTDPDRAFNSRTGQNFLRVACPPPAETGTPPPTKPKPTPKPTRSPAPPEKPKEQPGLFEFGFGYNYMRAPDESAKNLNGFGASLFYNVTPHVAVGGDFGALFGSGKVDIGPALFDVSLHRQTYLFGPQFNFYPSDNVKVFVHPLFGGVHDAAMITNGTTSVSSSASAFAMAFGGGVDVNLNNRFAIRPFAFDYMPTHFGSSWQSNFRYSAGFVLHIGGH